MKKLITVLVISISLTGCATSANGENSLVKSVGAMVGAAAMAFGGSRLDGVAGTGSLFTTLGAGLGAVIGGELAHYLTKQDKENLEQVLIDTKQSKPVAWCSDSKNVSKNVNNVQCGSTNKIVAIPGAAVKDNQGEICRPMKTEVVKPNGDIATETQNLCQAKDGKWHEKTA